jgi:serine protease Do
MQEMLLKNYRFENLHQTGKAFASVAHSVSPSVVFIRVEGKASSLAL